MSWGRTQGPVPTRSTRVPLELARGNLDSAVVTVVGVGTLSWVGPCVDREVFIDVLPTYLLV